MKVAVRIPKHKHPINDLLELLGRRWALRILWELRDAPLPFRRLRELVAAGVIEQTDAGYALTASGRELLDHLRPLNDWAKRRLR